MSGVGEMIVWGSGEPRREFLHVDDLAAAVLFLLENTIRRKLSMLVAAKTFPFGS